MLAGMGRVRNPMRTKRKSQTFRLQLLALVLAAALGWYSVNPSPVVVRRREREGERPDEGERRAGQGAVGRPVDERFRPARLPVGQAGTPQPSSPSRADESGELDWPEFIDFD